MLLAEVLLMKCHSSSYKCRANLNAHRFETTLAISVTLWSITVGFYPRWYCS